VDALGALAEVSRALAGALHTDGGPGTGPVLDYRRVAEATLVATEHLLPGSAGHVWEVVPGARELTLVAARGFKTAPPDLSFPRLRVGEGLTGLAAWRRVPLASLDVPDDPRFVHREWLRREGLCSALVLPLLYGGTLYGALTVFTRQRHEFSPAEIQLLEAVAAQAAAAMAAGRLFLESERRRQAAEALAEVGRLLSESLDARVVGQRAVESLRALLGPRMSAIYRLEPGTEDFVLFAAATDDPAHVDWNYRLPRGAATVGVAVARREPVATPDVLHDPRITIEGEFRRRVERSRFRAVLGVPLMVGPVVFGALSVGDVKGRVFTPDEVRLARAFADQAALALENARLYGEAVAGLARLKRLTALHQLVTSSLDLDRVLDVVAAAALDLTGGDLARVWVVDEEAGQLRLAVSRTRTGEPPPAGANRTLPLGQGLVGWVVAHRTFRYSPDLAADPLQLRADWVRAGGTCPRSPCRWSPATGPSGPSSS
jgi:GAF domain-containing protein